MTTITASTQARLAEVRTSTDQEYRSARKEVIEAEKNGASLDRLIEQQEAKFEAFSEANQIAKDVRAGTATDESVNAELDDIQSDVNALNDKEIAKDFLDMSPAEHLKMQRENPEEFRTQLAKVKDGADKQAVMIGLQNEINPKIGSGR